MTNRLRILKTNLKIEQFLFHHVYYYITGKVVDKNSHDEEEKLYCFK